MWFKYGLLIILVGLTLSFQDSTPPIPPIAWQMDWYDNSQNLPSQLWLSVDGQSPILIEEENFYDSYFSPNHSILSYVDNSTLKIINAETQIPLAELPAEIFPKTDNPLSFLNTRWINEETLLFNSMNDYRKTAGAWWNTNRFDVYSYHLSNHTIAELFAPTKGGWIFPSPDGNTVAVATADKIILLDSHTLKATYQTYSIETNLVGGLFGEGTIYPAINWSQDGQTLIFQTAEPGTRTTEQMCFITITDGEMLCPVTLEITSREYLWNRDLNQVATVDYISDDQTWQLTLWHVIDKTHKEPIFTLPASQQPLELIQWLTNGELLFAEVVEPCSENGTAARRYMTLEQMGQIAPWLDDSRLIVDMQSLEQDTFALALGDCRQISIELYENGNFMPVTVFQESDPLAYFRFVGS